MSLFKQIVESYHVSTVRNGRDHLFRYIYDGSKIVGRAVFSDRDRYIQIVNANGSFLPTRFTSWSHVEEYLSNDHLRLEQESVRALKKFMREHIDDS